MRLTFSAFLLIFTITICSIFIANVTNLISTDQSITHKLEQNDHLLQHEHDKLKIDDSADHLMWFIQISDLHINAFSHPDRIKQLREFTNKTVDAIKPSVVLASGDLTDGIAPNLINSGQFENEWKIYNDILAESGIKDKTVWLDIRGNHDNFDVPSVNKTINLFHKYGIQGQSHPRSYMHQQVISSDKYTFIAVDACLDPGPKRQFNFIGLLTPKDTEQLIDYVYESRRQGGNYTVWFGHYPTSCILAPGTGSSGIRNVFGQFQEGYVYLCGHLHTFGGMIPKFHTLHKEGFLELELGDWKQNRLYRVAAFDHGLFSFVDVRHNQWPVVLITNPKDPLYRIPTRENSQLQLASTHIRILAFSLDDVIECNVRLDNGEWETCEKVNKNLFVRKWNPQVFNDGQMHTIDVTVTDAIGRTKLISQQFTHGQVVDLQFSKMARFFLMTDVSTIFQTLFWTLMFLCVVPMTGFRIWHVLVSTGKLKPPQIKLHYLKRLVCKLWITSSVNRLFFPMVFYPIYLSFGPWSFGDVITGHTSVVFVWGIYVSGGFLPGGLTYLYGFFQLTLVQLPQIFVISNIVYRKFRQQMGTPEKLNLSICRKLYNNFGFVMIFIVEVLLMYIFYRGYGLVALIVDPLRTWSVIISAILFYQAHKLQPKHFRSASSVWRTDPNLIVVDKD